MGDGVGDLAFWLAVGAGQVAFWYAMTPLIKAFATRISAKGNAGYLTELEDRLAVLEGRALTSGEVESQFRHVAELEERLDFAERMLAERHDMRMPGVNKQGDEP